MNSCENRPLIFVIYPDEISDHRSPLVKSGLMNSCENRPLILVIYPDEISDHQSPSVKLGVRAGGFTRQNAIR